MLARRFLMGGLPLQNASPASAVSQVALITTSGQESKPKKKICCACPETKKLRDECIVEHGETSCAKWIEAHRQCLPSGCKRCTEKIKERLLSEDA
ncbi:unnamed protein product [Dovyalis caffra]|uniref:Cytochrome c oxidase copper chaperone n=1 Tax=Dovyalis caffra TaxID=77055 RepID=A0AAV1R574_9ROSI|nr:unnamed protein product [Dovyalis caffra]